MRSSKTQEYEKYFIMIKSGRNSKFIWFIVKSMNRIQSMMIKWNSIVKNYNQIWYFDFEFFLEMSNIFRYHLFFQKNHIIIISKFYQSIWELAFKKKIYIYHIAYYINMMKISFYSLILQKKMKEIHKFMKKNTFCHRSLKDDQSYIYIYSVIRIELYRREINYFDSLFEKYIKN